MLPPVLIQRCYAQPAASAKRLPRQSTGFNLFQPLMERLRREARGPDGFDPVLATPLRP